jgi:hypothetical protein
MLQGTTSKTLIVVKEGRLFTGSERLQVRGVSEEGPPLRLSKLSVTFPASTALYSLLTPLSMNCLLIDANAKWLLAHKSTPGGFNGFNG